MGRIALLLVFYFGVALAFGFDSPSSYALSHGGDLAPVGLPGVRSSPARLSDPGFGFCMFRLPKTDQLSVGLSGEWGSSWFRNAFVGSYESMDSIYRQVYTEWDFSVNRDWFILGAGYGLAMEWVPGEEWWNRHRYKIGTSWIFRKMYLSGLIWNDMNESFRNMHFLLGIYIKPGNSFDAFAQWDGYSGFMGSSLNFKYVSLSTFYRFPGFLMGANVSFSLSTWNILGSYAKSAHSLDWFGVGLEKKKQKKTIL